MGLGALFNRSITYTATDSVSGVTETFVINDGLAPDWSYGQYEGAMSIPGVWRAAILLADLLSQLPWHAYSSAADGSARLVDPTPVLLETPTPGETRMNTFSSMALDLLLHGNAIAVVAARDAQGYPTAIAPVPAEFVGVRRATQADGFMGVPAGAVIYSIGQETYAAQDIVHVKGPSRPGALRGMSVLESHLNRTFALATEQARQASQLSSYGVPSGVLKSSDPMFNADDARELKSSWLSTQRDRTVAVLNSTTEFQALAWSPEDTQLLEARKFSLHEIALIFGLDASWLGVASNSMTYSNVESEAINLVKFSLGGHLARFEHTLSAHLPPGMWAKANVDGLLRADTKSRYEAHSLALQDKWMTPDEVRAIEDMPPLTLAQWSELHPDTDMADQRTQRDLLKYWVAGEGRAKWTTSTEPLVALYEQLKKYLPADRAGWTALAWFELGMGRRPVPTDGQIPDGAAA